MRRWRLPLAVGILAALSAYVYFFEIQGEEKKQKQKEESEQVFSIKKDAIRGLTLTQHGAKIRVEKAEGQWKILEPFPTTPDSEAVDRLLGSLPSLKITHDLGKQQDLAPFNLQSPPVVLELSTTDSKSPPPLQVGDDAPTGGGIYARLGEGGVWIVSGADSLRGATLFSLRDKTFFKFDPAKLSGVSIHREKDEVSLIKSDGKWSLHSPVSAPAEDSTITDMVYALERLTVTEFVEEHPSEDSLAKRGLRPSRISVRLHGEEWKADPQFIFGNSESGSLFAAHPGTGALVKVSDSIQAKLNSPPGDLRQKEMLGMQRYDVGEVKITGVIPGGFDLKRKGDKDWERNSPSAAVLPDESVDALMQSLSDLKAAEFLDKPSGKLASYGLEPPQASLEFRKRGEEASAPSEIQVGKGDGHGKVFFRDSKWPFLSLIPEDLWKHATDQIRKVAEEKPPVSPATQTAPASPAPPSGK